MNCGEANCSNTSAVISSLESEDGNTLFNSPAGLKIGLCGLGLARANRLVRLPEDTKQRQTYGPNGFASSVQRALQPSLVNRLPLLELGLIASAMIWKPWITPSGRQFCQLRLLGKTMRAIGFTLLATPTATANQAAPSMQKHPGCKRIEVSVAQWRKRMGFPSEWANCVPTATRSFRKSPQSS